MAGKIKIKYLKVTEKRNGQDKKVIHPFFVVPLSDFFKYDPTIEDIARELYGLDHHTGKLTRSNIVQSVIECLMTLALNRNAREFLYEKYYPRDLKKKADDDTRIDRFISYALDEPVRFTDRDLGRPVPKFRAQRWSLSTADINLIILPINRQSLTFVNDHNKQLIRGRGRARFEQLKKEAFELHSDFIEHRKKMSKKIEEKTREYQVAQYIKYLIEVDFKKSNLVKIKRGIKESLDKLFKITSDIDFAKKEYTRIIKNFQEMVNEGTLQSDEKCRRLVDFLKKPDFQKLMSDRDLIPSAEAADNMSLLTNGMHLTASGQQYLKEHFGETVIEGHDTDPIWVSLREHAVTGVNKDKKNKNTDNHNYFQITRKTNSAIIAVLSYWAYTVKDLAGYEVKINKVFEYLRISCRIKITSIKFENPTGKILGEISYGKVKWQFKKVKLYDLEIKKTPHKIDKYSKFFESLDFFLQTINCLMVAHQIKNKIERNEWDAVMAANAMAGFGSSAIKLTGASKFLNWSKYSCLKAAGNVLGIVGGVTQSAMGMYDLYGDMSSMNPYKASGDFLLSAGGMLTAAGVVTAWAGVPTILIAIGTVMSAVGVIVKFWFSYSSKEKYIRGTRFYKHWYSLDNDEDKYFVVQGGFSHEYPRDEYDHAILHKWFYRFQVELAGDHGTRAASLQFKVKIFNEDRKLLWESEKDKEYLKFNHGIGTLFLPRSIRGTSDDKPDLKIRVALYHENALITDFDDFLIGDL